MSLVITDATPPPLRYFAGGRGGGRFTELYSEYPWTASDILDMLHHVAGVNVPWTRRTCTMGAWCLCAMHMVRMHLVHGATAPWMFLVHHARCSQSVLTFE